MEIIPPAETAPWGHFFNGVAMSHLAFLHGEKEIPGIVYRERIVLEFVGERKEAVTTRKNAFARLFCWWPISH
jgi:hypothetical protein